jgi:hypothetical protein
MKKNLFLTLALLAFWTASRPAIAGNETLTVAIFNFDSSDDNVRDLGPKIATLINANLSAEPQIITVERADLEKLLGEQELGLSGTISPDTAAKVGNLTGAKVLVTGRVFRADKDLFVVTKIISTETSRVYGELAKRPAASASIGDLATELAAKIAKVINEKGDTLVAKVESREQKIDRIVKSLKEGKRPSVSVKLEEKHFGAAVIDPAAETELSSILQKAGFTVADEKADTKPDIEITGEAFSAYGLRKGNLISCRSRIELKAHDRTTGKILAVDSQTSVAVDIAEQTAAKISLQNAAVGIAERLLPKLITP